MTTGRPRHLGRLAALGLAVAATSLASTTGGDEVPRRAALARAARPVQPGVGDAPDSATLTLSLAQAWSAGGGSASGVRGRRPSGPAVAAPLSELAAGLRADCRSGRATVEQARRAFAATVLDSLDPKVGALERQAVLEALRVAVPVLLPDDDDARPGTAGRVAFGSLTLSPEEVRQAAGPPTGRDRTAVVARLRALRPEETAGSSDADLVALVPSLVAARDSTWRPSPALVAGFRARMGLPTTGAQQ